MGSPWVPLDHPIDVSPGETVGIAFMVVDGVAIVRGVERVAGKEHQHGTDGR